MIIRFPFIFIVVCFLVLFRFNLNSTQQQFYIRYCNTPNKIVALTFDDGPHPTYTQQILNILKEYDILATFFMTGKSVINFPDLAQLVFKEGHTIGNHSYDHTRYNSLSANDIISDLSLSQRAFFNTFGFFPSYFRPPYGELSLEHIPLLKSYFRLAIKWNVDSLDWKWHTSGTMIANRVLENIKPGSIILFHDTHPSTVSSLPIIINKLLKDGYTFVTISDLVHAGDLTPVWNRVL